MHGLILKVTVVWDSAGWTNKLQDGTVTGLVNMNQEAHDNCNPAQWIEF